MHSPMATAPNCPWTSASKGGARNAQGWSNVLDSTLNSKTTTTTTGLGARRRGGAGKIMPPETRGTAAEARKSVSTSPTTLVVTTTTLGGAVDVSEIVTAVRTTTTYLVLPARPTPYRFVAQHNLKNGETVDTHPSGQRTVTRRTLGDARNVGRDTRVAMHVDSSSTSVGVDSSDWTLHTYVGVLCYTLTRSVVHNTQMPCTVYEKLEVAPQYTYTRHLPIPTNMATIHQLLPNYPSCGFYAQICERENPKSICHIPVLLN